MTLGPMTYVWEGGTLRWLRWRGVEVVRGLSAPVRDEGWGTFAEEHVRAEDRVEAGRARHERWFSVGGALEGRLVLEASAEGWVEAEVELTARRPFATNRAGFTLLHPLRGIAGTEGEAVGPDGAVRRFAFPERVAPAQPVTGLAGLRHRVAGVTVEIDLKGEVFEMEDQRNWSDASFKTYCRPLALPLPIRLAPGETLRQRATIRLSGRPEPLPTGTAAATTAVMPEVLLAVEPGWLADAPPPASGLLMRWGPAAEWSDADLARLAALGAPLDLEAVIPEGRDPAAALAALAARLADVGLVPRHVVALPEPYLASHQPGGPWPLGPTPEDAARAASEAFPEARVGAGMLTNFTELNRRPVAGGAYVTHGNAAIVHAADDASVFETLEALPAVLASARAIAGARALRLGLVAIGMRSNPYGPGLAPNPEGRRMTMTDADPRQDGPEAAAYAVAFAALAARAGAEAIALAAPAGPFGAQAHRPIRRAVAAVAALAGRPVEITGDPPGRVAIADGPRRIEANASTRAEGGLPPFALPLAGFEEPAC